METETPLSRAAPSAGSALPALGAEQRAALTRYAVQLLEGAAAQAGEIVEGAILQVASANGALPGGSGEPPEDASGALEERTLERIFAAVHRSSLARLRQAGITQKTAVAFGEEAAGSLPERVGRLTPKQREVVWLKFSHGFGYEAIAGITGLSVHNVGFLLHSALTNLGEVKAARGGSAAAVEDARITNYVLGEMGDGERESFRDTWCDDADAKAAVGAVEAMARELRGALGGREATKKGAKKRVAGGFEFWRATWFYAALALLIGGWVATVVWREWSANLVRAKAVGDGAEFQLRPDAWKLAQAREEAGERTMRGGSVNGAADSKAAAPVRASRAANERSRPKDKPINVGVALPASGGGDAAGVGGGSGGGEAAEDAGAGAKASPTASNDAPVNGKQGTGEGQAAAAEIRAPKGVAENNPNRPSDSEAKRLAALTGGGGRAPVDPDRTPAKQAKNGTKSATEARALNGVTARSAASLDPAPELSRPADEKEPSLVALQAGLTVNPGHAPIATSVVALLDYFPAEHEATAGEPPVATSVEVAEAPWAAERRLVRVVVRAARATPERQATANVVFLIDVSGSMAAPNRLALVQAAARRFLHELRPADRVAIVTYAGDARVALAPTPVARAAEIRAVLTSLQAEGMTNGSAGLRTAYAVARGGLVVGGVNRVIMCTDGDFNMGVTSEGELAALVEAEAKAGVELAVYGFGRGRQIDPRLESLATKGRGGSGNVNTRREAERRLVGEVEGWRPAVARDLRLEFECDPRRVVGCRLIGYEENFLPPETVGRRAVEVRELAPGETATALFEVELTRSERERRTAADQWLTLRVGYTAVAKGEAESIVLPVLDRGAPFAEASSPFKFSAAVAGFGTALRESPPSRKKIAAVITWADAAAADFRGRDPGGYREEFLTLAREAWEFAAETGKR